MECIYRHTKKKDLHDIIQYLITLEDMVALGKKSVVMNELYAGKRKINNDFDFYDRSIKMNNDLKMKYPWI